MPNDTRIFNGQEIELTDEEQIEKNVNDAMGPIESYRLDAHEVRITKLLADSIKFVDNGNSYSMEASAIDNWQKLATTLQAEINAGVTEATEQITMFTKTNEIVYMNVNEALLLLAKIGKQAREVQTRNYQWEAVINAAESQEELDAIIDIINLS